MSVLRIAWCTEENKMLLLAIQYSNAIQLYMIGGTSRVAPWTGDDLGTWRESENFGLQLYKKAPRGPGAPGRGRSHSQCRLQVTRLRTNININLSYV